MVIADKAVVGDLLEVVPILEQLEIEDQAAGRRDELALIFDADLPFGKYPELALELLLRPGLHAGKTTLLQRDHLLPSRTVARAARRGSFRIS